MVEDLFKITLSDQSITLINQIKRLSPSLAAEIKRVGINAVSQAGQFALDAAKSSVPVDTQELRNSIITLSKPSPTAVQPQATVFIAQVTHYGRDRKPIDAGKLADILNNSGLNRSQPSAAVSGFPSYTGLTRGWVEKAQNNFLKRIDRFLASKDFTK